MVLVIDRGSTKIGYYTIQFGPTTDVFIFDKSIWMLTALNEIPEVDRIVTLSAELKYCVMYMKHPLLISNSNNILSYLTSVLREYFDIRMFYRQHEVTLYEFGKRLFK